MGNQVIERPSRGVTVGGSHASQLFAELYPRGLEIGAIATDAPMRPYAVYLDLYSL